MLTIDELRDELLRIAQIDDKIKKMPDNLERSTLMRDVMTALDKVVKISPIKGTELAKEWGRAKEKSHTKRAYTKIERSVMKQKDYEDYLSRMRVIVANNDHKAFKSLSDEIFDKYTTKDDSLTPLEMITDLRMSAIGKPTGNQTYLRK